MVKVKEDRFHLMLRLMTVFIMFMNKKIIQKNVLGEDKDNQIQQKYK